MHILLFHPVRLPPCDYGGVERVLLWLAQGLLHRGHRVTIAALAGSQGPAGCEWIPVEKRAYSADELGAIFPSTMDLAHFMAPLPQEVWESLPFPALLTVHGNGRPGERYPKNTVFLSHNHAQRHQATRFIYNGIHPNEYQWTPHLKEDSYLFLSKTNWRVKNVAGAMRLCQKANVRLRVAGGTRPFWSRLKCLFSAQWVWEGPVAGQRKAKLLACARGLVFPVTWSEPFGLVVVEALMSGTPVFAPPTGSLPELIPPEVGYLLSSEEQWEESLRRHQSTVALSEQCRNWAMKKFHFLQMAEAYEKAYREVISGKTLHLTEPQTQSASLVEAFQHPHR